MLGQMDVILIGGAILLLFGPKKFPDLMKGLGQGMKEFKKAQTDFEEQVTKSVTSYETTNKPEENKP
ncbi:MAG: twin-arginine translocase TatA/TatE family subunit [Chlorobium sp.]|nr:MAG: twin-arginine translocase TatA/TatE family subunit [Chlorobium sp.]